MVMVMVDGVKRLFTVIQLQKSSVFGVESFLISYLQEVQGALALFSKQ